MNNKVSGEPFNEPFDHPEPSSVKVFWMVSGPQGTSTVRHPTRESAEQEAIRLCEKDDKVFWVLEAVGRAQRKPNPVSYEVIGG